MKRQTKNIIEQTLTRVQKLAPLKDNIISAVELLTEAAQKGNKILLCGNGGSCSDCEHIVGEMMKEFYIKRPLPDKDKKFLTENFGVCGEEMARLLQGSIAALSLSAQSGIISAFSNDASPALVYAQQVYGYGREGDVLIGLSTSGNAKNVVSAAIAAKLKKVRVIAFTGQGGGQLKEYADVLLNVEENETYLIQELHLPLYHLICRCVENEVFGE